LVLEKIAEHGVKREMALRTDTRSFFNWMHAARKTTRLASRIICLQIELGIERRAAEEVLDEVLG
jgi:hypothetical protein